MTATIEQFADLRADQHWRQFTEFCLYELAAGGPDPHMRYVTWMSRNETEIERAWRAGMYAVGVYNVATAEAIWQHWPADKAAADPDGLTAWISDNWTGLKLRRERRAIRTRTKLAHSLNAYRAWVDRLLKDTRPHLSGDPETAYRQMWDEAALIPGAGRYASFKLLETLTRMIGLPITLPDLRPYGGWSPRLTLAALYPTLCSPNEAYIDRRGAVANANQVGEQAHRQLVDMSGLPINRYCMEVFLCDYRQSYEGRRQYPGRSNDSELDYARAISPYWAGRVESQMPAARAALTPAWARGELHGWDGVRDELGPVLSTHGYTWSDLRYRWGLSMNTAEPEPTGSSITDARALAIATLKATI